MRNLLPILTALLLVTCVRSPGSHRPPPPYDASIRFPRALKSPGLRLGQLEQRVRMDGAIVQAIMVVTRDFIPPSSGSDDCFTKPGDFDYDVLRDGDIIFVRISPNYDSCERGPWPLDWGAKYAISTDGRILTQINDDYDDGPEWESPPSSPDAGTDEDAGYRRLYDLKDLVPMISGPVDDPPFFTRPEWLAQHPWPPSRKPHAPSDGGTPDGGFHADGGSPALPPR